MGTSNWQNISYCIDVIRKIAPKKILDAGIGFGRWGILSREFLEVWEGRVRSKDWELQIDGVEIFNSNIEEYLKYFYSNIYNIDAYQYINSTPDFYDLIIIGDMLEHLEKRKANDFLHNCMAKSKFVMINIPIGNDWEQSEMYGNIYEKHLSYWKVKDFDIYKPIKIKVFRDYILRKFVVIILSKYESVLPSKINDLVFAVKYRLKRILKF